mmetsp:Transcript_4315/g.8307  ORF Transcript_4315/g.8307 Transcript_4315/m.8307 type:complete len:139 (+) Transcript_4315:1-417(+)
MKVVPLSAYNRLHAMVDEKGNWTGRLAEKELEGIPLGEAVSTEGPAGTITVHNARCVHSSGINDSEVSRPLLLNTFAAASAHMIHAGTNMLHIQSRTSCPIVRGTHTDFASMGISPDLVPMAPDFSGGYEAPFFKVEK